MDAREIIRRCRTLAEFTEETGAITRPYGSPAVPGAQQLVRAWMEEAGVSVHIDATGNVRGVRGPAPRVLIGSHIDTVPNAGAFDGVVGVILGIALARSGVEVVAFIEEEVS